MEQKTSFRTDKGEVTGETAKFAKGYEIASRQSRHDVSIIHWSLHARRLAAIFMLPAANRQQKVRNAKPRLRSGGLLAFWLHSPAHDNKAERKRWLSHDCEPQITNFGHESPIANQTGRSITTNRCLLEAATMLRRQLGVSFVNGGGE